MARRRFISRAGVVPEENHPVCARIRRLRDIFLMGAATPPNLGGEFPFGGFATFTELPAGNNPRDHDECNEAIVEAHGVLGEFNRQTAAFFPAMSCGGYLDDL